MECVSKSNFCYCGLSSLKANYQCVVLGCFLTVLKITCTSRREISHWAPGLGKMYLFYILIITPKVDLFSHSCLPIVDFLPDLSSGTILFLVYLDSSLVLAMCRQVYFVQIMSRCYQIGANNTGNDYRIAELLN